MAAFSPFHFHRLFKVVTGETLSRFIGRLRIEKATSQLLYNPGKSITEIALDCGFSSLTVFSRAFKETLGISASEYRDSDVSDSRLETSNRFFRKAIDEICKDIEIVSAYVDPRTNNRTWKIATLDQKEIIVEIKEIPEIEIAYIRHIGLPRETDNMELFRKMYEKLVRWGYNRDVITPPKVPIVVLFHDPNEITEDDKRRFSLCIT